MDSIKTDNITYGTTVIDYDIEFATRTTLGIKVNPDGSVYLKAPIDAT